MPYDFIKPSRFKMVCGLQFLYQSSAFCIEPPAIHHSCEFLHASALDQPYYYCNNCNNKQNMDDATGVKREKAN